MEKSLRNLVDEHTGRPLMKVDHYLDVYERYFQHLRGKPTSILEIGIYKGGSLQLWKNYFGKDAKIFGVDITEECKSFEEDQIKIYIGDQESEEFLDTLIHELPALDIIIDDGGHTMGQQITTFRKLYDKLKPNGIYLCEDCGSSYVDSQGGGYLKETTFIELMKTKIDYLNAWRSEDPRLKVNEFTLTTKSISYFPGMVVLEKGIVERPKIINTAKSTKEVHILQKDDEMLDKISTIIKLIYDDNDTAAALELLEKHIPHWSLEYKFFKSKIFALQKKIQKTITVRTKIYSSLNINDIQYLLDFKQDELLVDLINLGLGLRKHGYLEKSDQYLSALLKKQLKNKLTNQTTIIQDVIYNTKEQRYLEINPLRGFSFLQIDAKMKCAIGNKSKISFSGLTSENTEIISTEALDFLERDHENLGTLFDVIFIHGVKEYKILLNLILKLKEIISSNGTIVLNCSLPMDNSQDEVYKTVLWLRSFRSDLKVTSFRIENGMSFISNQKHNYKALDLSEEDIQNFKLEEHSNDLEQYLNIKPISELDQYI